MRILACHQSSFLPWLGWWDKLLVADVFVWMDDVAYKRQNYINRVKLSSPHGIRWLTLPVQKFSLAAPISSIRTSASAVSHLRDKLLGWWPDRAQFVERLCRELSGLPPELDAFNWAALRFTQQAALPGASPRVVRSSSLVTRHNKTRRLLEYCQALGCDAYYSGRGAKAYLDEDLLGKNGVQIIWQEFDSEPYHQRYCATFERGVSILDAVLNGVDLSSFIDRCAYKRRQLHGHPQPLRLPTELPEIAPSLICCPGF